MRTAIAYRKSAPGRRQTCLHDFTSAICVHQQIIYVAAGRRSPALVENRLYVIEHDLISFQPVSTGP
jgi:hypothetical protein